MLGVGWQHQDGRGGVRVEALVEDHVLPEQLQHFFGLLADANPPVEIGQPILRLEDGEESLDVDFGVVDLVDVHDQLLDPPLESVLYQGAQ